MKELYGFAVIRPQAMARIELEPTTWRHVLYRALGALYTFFLLGVIAGSITILLR